MIWGLTVFMVVFDIEMLNFKDFLKIYPAFEYSFCCVQYEMYLSMINNYCHSILFPETLILSEPS